MANDQTPLDPETAQPAETPAPSPGKGNPLRRIGVVAVGVLVVCLGWLLVSRIQGANWALKDTLLAVFTAVGASGTVFCYWDRLAGRGTLLSLNSILMTLLVLGIIILLNVIAQRHLKYLKIDWTSGKFYSLSDQTVNVLRSVKPADAIEIIGITAMDQTADPRVQFETRMLEEYGRISKHVTVEIIDANIDSRAKEILESGALSAVPGVVIQRKGNQQVREGVTSLSEAEVTRGLLKLLDPASRKVYFLTGHGERSITDTSSNGLDYFKRILENDRYTVEELELFKQPSVPTDAACVVAVWPRTDFTPDDLTKLETYLSRPIGGRLLAFVDPDKTSNLAGLLKKYGIEFKPEVVEDASNSVYIGGQADFFASVDYGQHEATDLLLKVRRPVIFLRAGRLVKDAAAVDYEVVDLVKTSSSAFAEQKAAPKPQPKPGAEPTAETASSNRAFGPLTIAMSASTKDPEPPADEEQKDEAKPAEDPNQKRVRVAAVADGDFPTNAFSSTWSNPELSANLVAWLTDNSKVIGIRAKDPSAEMDKRKITLDRKGKVWVWLLTLALPVLLILGAGAAVQIVRR